LKRSNVRIETRSPLALLQLKGLTTWHGTVKWAIVRQVQISYLEISGDWGEVHDVKAGLSK